MRGVTWIFHGLSVLAFISLLGPSPASAGMPTPGSCPPGGYLGSTGCLPCPPGHYQKKPNQTTCQRCPAGTTSGEGQASCVRIPGSRPDKQSPAQQLPIPGVR